MRTIIFSILITGHRLEYLHHIYDVCKTKKENDYIFVVPIGFNDNKDMYQWDKAENISFDFMPATKTTEYKASANEVKYLCELINEKTRVHNAYNVFNIELEFFTWHSMRYLDKRIRLSGIVYDIFKYKFPVYKWRGKLSYLMSQIVYSHSSHFKNALLLNDADAPKFMNRLFLTNKYKFIPDPYIPLPEPTINIREKYSIPTDKIIISHFGGLAKRKGTLLILDAIKMMSQEDLQKFTFIFAGRIYDDIKEEFYRKYEQVKQKASIIVEDSFCTYDYLASLSKYSDLVLLPYLKTARSSGIIGYASQFQTPVAVPRKGFVSKLVSKYNIGYLLEDCTPKYIAGYLSSTGSFSKQTNNSYCADHTIKAFQEHLTLTI